MIRRNVYLLVSVVFLAFSGVLLSAMLGQLDMILSGWYSNQYETWTFPLPTLHWSSGRLFLRMWEPFPPQSL